MIDTNALAERWGARLDGASRVVTCLASVGARGADVPEGALVFAFDGGAAREAGSTPGADRWAALVVPMDVDLPSAAVPLLRVTDPRLAFALASALYDRETTPPAGIATSADVDPSAMVDPTAHVGHGAVIGPDARIEAEAVVGDGCVVGARCVVGPRTRLFSRVVVYADVRLGERVRVHAGAVLGADGFGYAAGPTGAVKIRHLGGVEIGDDVEIGANACIDRGTLGDTTIGSGTKIDNLVQVGHNVRIGRHCLVAGAVAIGGTSVLEDGVMVGGGAAISDHVTIHAGARIAGRAAVGRNVPAGEAWGGMPAQPMKAFLRELYLVHRLEQIWEFVRTERRAKGDRG